MTAASLGIRHFSEAHLRRIARLFAGNEDHLSRVDSAATERTRIELDTTAYLEVWLIAWPPGTSTGWHDHGGASGAFHVVRGSLTQETWRAGQLGESDLTEGEDFSFAPGVVHNTTNIADGVALSVHAYSPGLSEMTPYGWRHGHPEPLTG